MKHVEILNISDNLIKDISPISKSSSIKVIKCNYNLIESIPSFKNSGIEILELNFNAISEIKGIEELKSLKELKLGNNNIENISNLKNIKLRILKLNNNKIQKINDLENQTELEYLDLSNNKLTIISLVNFKWTKLIELNLDNNYLSSISEMSSLTKITKLDLQNNQLESIENLLKLNTLEFVSLKGNPIFDEIPEVVKESGWNAIRQRFLDGKLIAFNKVKILFLGNTNVGKTNLLEFFETKKEPKNKISTFGIQYKKIENTLNNIELHCWDFGGQEFFHATHHLFFSPESIHIILWSKQNIQRENEEEVVFNIEYWLRCVEQLTSKDSNIPTDVIIIENKIDLNDLKPFPLDQVKLTESFKSLNLIFTNINLIPLKRTDSLLEILNEHALKLCKKHPNKYVEYFKIIDDSTKDIIDLEAISKDNIDEVKIAMSVFNKMGLILYFPDIIPDKAIISPQTLLDLIYKNILDNPKIWKLTYDEIKTRIANNTLEIEVSTLVKLLKHFDLVFEITNEPNVLFIPQYLPATPPFIDFFQQFQFENPNIIIESDNYLMNIVLLKVFSNYGKYVHGSTNEYLFWKDGIIIKKDNKLLMLNFNREKQQISIYSSRNASDLNIENEIIHFIIKIPQKNSNEQFSYDLNNQDLINENKLENSEFKFNWSNNYFKIKISLDGKYFIDWNNLYENSKNGIFQIEAHTIDKTESKIYNIYDFNKYLPDSQRGEMKKIFISYSKDDLQLVKVFQDHLSALKLDGKISTWYCTELKAGSNWDHEIQSNFDDSDIVCFMISPNFMKTKYIHEHEIKKAFEKKKKNKSFLIIPIILDFCRWQTKNNDLSQFTALPYTTKPIKDFKNENLGWYLVEEALRLLLQGEKPDSDLLFNNEKLPQQVIDLYIRIKNVNTRNDV